MRKFYTRVEVTADDIRNGVRSDCECCAVALALWRATDNDWHVMSSTARPRLGNDTWGKEVRLPLSARDLIHALDYLKPHTPAPEPITFLLPYRARKRNSGPTPQTTPEVPQCTPEAMGEQAKDERKEKSE